MKEDTKMTDIDYPEEWNELPKRERKQKIRGLKKQNQKKADSVRKIRNISIAVVLVVIAFGALALSTKKSPEEAAFIEEVREVSLEGRVEEFEIEGQEHVSPRTDVEYKTNPPTSGSHLAQAENWGVYGSEIDNKAAVHGLEHGGVWISYKDVEDDAKTILEDIGRSNPLSTIVSPRSGNDDKIVVASWGRMMKLEVVDKALIQKYIDTYKNQSPEKLAR